MPSYRDLHITTKYTERTPVSELSSDHFITCDRDSGWMLWRNDDIMGNEMIAGEHCESGLRLDVAGHVIADNLTH